jgi:TatD DNase family protein
MNLPGPEDYIDIHTHGGTPSGGIFKIECILAHEDRFPEDLNGIAYTFGIHPWFLNDNDFDKQIVLVEKAAQLSNVIAIGEAGFDKLRGPSREIQNHAFERQVSISEVYSKPLIIHCVKGWDDLLAAHKKLKPEMPWMIHGFRGSIEQAEQLLSRGFYISVWFDFALREESAQLLRYLPKEKIFLETDGADVDIRNIYSKVAADLDISVEKLKSILKENFISFFKL